MMVGKIALWAVCALSLFAAPAFAQSTVQACGPATSGHLIMYTGQGCAVDAGGPTTAGGTPPNSVNADTLPNGVAFVNSGQGIVQYSGYASGSYSTLSTGFDGSGNATFTVSATVGAPTCSFVINGVSIFCDGVRQATWADNQTCSAGQIAADASFIYICTAANTVKRVALTAF